MAKFDGTRGSGCGSWFSRMDPVQKLELNVEFGCSHKTPFYNGRLMDFPVAGKISRNR